MKTPASKKTTEQFGIVEWKIFRSKTDLLMTGYDKNGKAVKGVAAGFGKSADSSEAVVRTKVNDGSKFTAIHGLSSHKTLANGSLSDDGDAFIKAAFTDASKTNLAYRTNLKAGGAADTGAECGADLSAIVAQALACTQSSKAGEAAQAACVAAAQKAADSAEACQSTGATTPKVAGAAYDPNDPAFDPTAAGFDPSMFGGATFDPAILSKLGIGLDQLGADPFGMGEDGEICADGMTGEVGWDKLGTGGGWGDIGGGGWGGLGGYDMGGGGGWTDFLGGGGGWGGFGGFDLGGVGGWGGGGAGGWGGGGGW